MRRIKLTQGKYTLVSTIDFEYLNQWKWYARKQRSTWYAVRDIWIPVHKILYMHRLIHNRLYFNTQMQTDHKDQNGLNNQRNNLRVATNTENNRNKKKQRNNTSGYKGVYWSNQGHKWFVQICVNKRLIYLGYFTEKLEAAKVYNKAAKKYFGEFAYLNPV
jgi:hypothetical protein